jgi:hypothetical protein
MFTIDVVDDISAIIRILERVPILILAGGFFLIGMLLRD